MTAPLSDLQRALDLLSTLAPHRVRGKVVGQGTEERVVYEFCVGDHPQLETAWGGTLDATLDAMRRELGLQCFHAVASKPITSGLYVKGQATGMVKATGDTLLIARARATAQWYQNKLDELAAKNG